MKKIILSALTVISLFSLCSCNGKEGKSVPTRSTDISVVTNETVSENKTEEEYKDIEYSYNNENKLASFKILSDLQNYYDLDSDISTFSYKGDYYDEDLLDTYSSWENYNGVEIKVGLSNLKRVYLNNYKGYTNLLIWENGSITSPLKHFVGTWTDDKGNYVNIKSISDYNEIIFDVCIKNVIDSETGKSRDILLENCNSVIGNKSLLLDLKENFQYATRFEYQDDVSVFGSFKEQEQTFVLSSELLFSLNKNYIYLNLIRGFEFKNHISLTSDFKQTVTNDYLKGFGSDDLDDSHFNYNNEDYTEALNLLNSYLKSVNQTPNYDYTKDTNYIYKFKYLNYDVFKNNDNYYYVDVENKNIILEYPKYDSVSLETKYVKLRVLKDGTVLKDIPSMFAGTYTSDKVDIIIKEDDKLDINFKNSCLPNITDVDYQNMYKVFSNDVESCISYFEYSEGVKVLAGYVYYNVYTGNISLHITRSKIVGAEVGIYTF